MKLGPLLDASLPIRLHAFAALVAFVLGITQLLRRKGDPLHGWVGYVWVALLLVVAASSFGIHEIRQWRGYSLIHLLSLFVLVNVPYAVWCARTGRIAAHRKSMLGTFFGGLLLAGAFTFLPGRIMHAVLLGS